MITVHHSSSRTHTKVTKLYGPRLHDVFSFSREITLGRSRGPCGLRSLIQRSYEQSTEGASKLLLLLLLFLSDLVRVRQECPATRERPSTLFALQVFGFLL